MNKWEPRWVFGFALLACVTGFGIALALGKVVEATSYGLHEILLIFGLLAAQWANGMFGSKSNDDKK